MIWRAGFWARKCVMDIENGQGTKVEIEDVRCKICSRLEDGESGR
jgi:hypothetical protein